MNKIELRKRTPEERAAYAEGFAAGYQKGLEPQTVILRTTLLLYESEYDEVRALGFEYVVYTLYRLDWNAKTDWRALGEFAAAHPLIGFTFSYELCPVEGFVEGMLRSGVPLYIHTVNEGEEAYFDMGISGVYTDIVR